MTWYYIERGNTMQQVVPMSDQFRSVVALWSGVKCLEVNYIWSFEMLGVSAMFTVTFRCIIGIVCQEQSFVEGWLYLFGVWICTNDNVYIFCIFSDQDHNITGLYRSVINGMESKSTIFPIVTKYTHFDCNLDAMVIYNKKTFMLQC